MKKLSFLLLSLCASFSFAQTFYNLNTIQTIEITFAQSNYNALLIAAEPSDAYIEAQSVSINGTVLPTVGVKFKGNSSYNASQAKNPYHIELDTYVDQSYDGYTDIKLSNVIFDPTFVREALGYKILANYMDVPKANFAKLYINGNYIGLYTNVESISKKFVDNRFGSNTNAFFSCSPPAGAGPTTTNLPNLAYLGTSYTSYESAYEMKSDVTGTGWADLITLTNILSTTTSTNTANLEAVLDVDRALWMLAFDNAFVNIDSYIGQFKQNYYLYKADNGQFNPIVWDLNMSFGVFGMTGSGANLTTSTKKTLSHTLHSTESAWPLVQKLLAIPTYKKRYIAHYKTIMSEMIATGTYLTDAQAIQSLIYNDFVADTNKFSYQTTSNFTNNLNSTDVTVAGNSAPGIAGLMSARNTYITGLSDFTATQPTIASITPSSTTPSVGSTVSITANVTNTTTSSVFLGYRSTKNDIFVKTQMYDDGAHNDGAANDNVYGASIPVNSVQVQYYIYAENTNAGKFSPARAEYEYYTINATYPTLVAGQLVINEIMASNATTVTDQDGQYDDWFEIYNTTGTTLSLDNLYASDSQTNKLKYQFPTGTTIAPYSYLIVWADSDLTQVGYHADFKFSASGEHCILSYQDGTILDTVTFPAQTTDMSYARSPNGTGSWVIKAPTYNVNNDSLGTSEVVKNSSKFNIYPNPTSDFVTVNSDDEKIDRILVYNMQGRVITNKGGINKTNYTVDLSAYPTGVYILKVNDKSYKVIKK